MGQGGRRNLRLQAPRSLQDCPKEFDSLLLGATKGFKQKHGRIGLQLRSELGHVEPECEGPEHLGGCVIFSRDCRESLIFFFSRISHLTTPSFCLVLKAEGSTGRAVGSQIVLLLKPMNVQGDCPCVGNRWPLVLESLGVSSSSHSFPASLCLAPWGSSPWSSSPSPSLV